MAASKPKVPRKAQHTRRETEADPTKYDDECLAVLAYEFRNIDPPEEAERKIKRRLREKKLGAYDARRFAEIRRFKDDLQDELYKADKSEYYAGRHGRCAHPDDFDGPRLVREFSLRHPTVSVHSVARFVPFAVYIYYLR